MSYCPFELLDQTKPVVVFGRDGQVGRALQVCLNDLKVLTVFLGRNDCNLSNESSIREVLDHYQPQVIINAAAYTAVDKAETERDLAFAVNAKAPAVMAHYMANVAHGILVHYSTDYVFADTKQTAYLETDVAGPVEQLSVYGQSKLAGEQAIEEAFNLAQDSGHTSFKDKFSRYFILRTSWVYGSGDNFVKRILGQLKNHENIIVVSDQVGVPTSSEWLAEITLSLMSSEEPKGIYHVVPDGEVSRLGLAKYIREVAVSCNLGDDLGKINGTVTSALESKKIRPLNSRISNEKLKIFLDNNCPNNACPVWQGQLKQYIRDFVNNLK